MTYQRFSPEKGVEVALVEVLALRELRPRSAGGTEVDDCQGVAPLHRRYCSQRDQAAIRPASG